MKTFLLSLIVVLAVSCTEPSNDNNNVNNTNNLTCGNSSIEMGEVCDSENLAGQDCTDHGFTSGVLQCAADCQSFNTSWCEGQVNNVNNVNNINNWTPPTNSRIYVNTEDTLYYIDPGVSDEMVEVGDFSGVCVTNDTGFYDIAVDAADRMLGIAANALYTINPETAECTVLYQFPTGSPHFFALSYVKGVDPENLTADKLIGASAEDGEWVLIDPQGETINEIFASLGYYDFPDMAYVSSGDIISVQTGATTFKTYATLKCDTGYNEVGCESDWLAEINPESGDARLIGQTGYQQIFGLGFWGDKVYGFTNKGEYIVIDVDTGAGTLVHEYAGQSFWGAGNTTIPYVVE
ncbi:hypothetical protein KKF84_04065 [Myxococcota bacterium]|nr:hypothetical protein [Myxococcota bacterium]MBU1534470.1 hypothetical protein [Myxococcota bacterium]